MKQPIFRITAQDPKTAARTGVLATPRGIVETPSYVMVATHAKIKCLEPDDIKKTKTQIVIANTYHLWHFVPEEFSIKPEKSFILRKLKTRLPTMTDSGGFQVFSFGAAQEHSVGKILERRHRHQEKPSNIRITERGVYFLLDGKRHFLDPKLSIQLQEKIGADIIFAFDECTSPLHSFTYNAKAMERTHRWAVECLNAKTRNDQMLFGIAQGGRFRSLRIASAKFIGLLPSDGFGIGGSFGKDEMVATLDAVIPYLPESKPRHLLGIGKIEDIFNAVEHGIDLFDCVVPTREARHGRIWTANGAYDIRKSIYTHQNTRLEKNCKCPACASGMTKAKLHALFKKRGLKAGLSADLPAEASAQAEAMAKAGRYATMHNVWFFNTLLERIRSAIKKGAFPAFKKRCLSQLP